MAPPVTKTRRKPGAAQSLRRKHVEQQARRDALAALRLGKTVNVYAIAADGGRVVAVRPMTETEPDTLDVGAGGEVLCLFNQKLRVMTYVEPARRSANRHKVADQTRVLYLPRDRIYGVVIATGVRVP